MVDPIPKMNQLLTSEQKTLVSKLLYSDEEKSEDWPYSEKQISILNENQESIGEIRYNIQTEATGEKFLKIKFVRLDGEYRNGAGVEIYEKLVSLSKEKGLDGIKSDHDVSGGALATWKKLQDKGYVVDINPKIQKEWENFLEIYKRNNLTDKEIVVPSGESVFELHLKRE